MSLLNTHRLSECPLNRRVGDTDLWEMQPAFKRVLDFFLADLNEPLFCSRWFQIFERPDGVQ